VKNWIFDDSFHNKVPVLVILVVEAVEVIETAEVLRSGKFLLRTLESSRFLNLA
jgi:hypothetical protein